MDYRCEVSAPLNHMFLFFQPQHTTHPAVTEGSDDGGDDFDYYPYYYYDDGSSSISQRTLTKCEAVCDETDSCWAITWNPADSWCDMCIGMPAHVGG